MFVASHKPHDSQGPVLVLSLIVHSLLDSMTPEVLPLGSIRHPLRPLPRKPRLGRHLSLRYLLSSEQLTTIARKL